MTLTLSNASQVEYISTNVVISLAAIALVVLYSLNISSPFYKDPTIPHDFKC